MGNPRIERFEKLLATNPESPLPRFSLASAYADDGQHQKAIEHFEKCIEAQPDWAACLIALADSYEEVGDKDKAIAALKQARVHAMRQGHSSMADEAQDKLEDLGESVD